MWCTEAHLKWLLGSSYSIPLCGISMEHTPSDISMTWEEVSRMTRVLVKCFTKKKKKKKKKNDSCGLALVGFCDFNKCHLSKDLTANLWNVDLVHIKVIETVLEFHVDLICKKQ